MAVSRSTTDIVSAPRPLVDFEPVLARFLTLDMERVAYLALFILAIVSRFWDLGARVMSHDESLHTRYSWGLYRGDGFQHTPLMHGPVLFHMVALSYLLFGDSDFSARIYPALLGVLIVMFPLFLRRWLGKWGALSASFMFLISPMILYYSRYIREDMPAIMGALIMVFAIWRYIENRQFKYLVWLAFGQFYLFASKEVSFIYVAIFGSFLTCYFVYRLLGSKWNSRRLYLAFGTLIIVTLLILAALGTVLVSAGAVSEVVSGTQTAAPLDPTAGAIATETAHPLNLARDLLTVALAVGIAALAGVVMVGQWRNLRRYPELDLMVIMGTLILASLTPFLILRFGFDPMSETAQGIQTTVLFTLGTLLVSLVVGLVWGIVPPKVQVVAVRDDKAPSDSSGAPETVDVPPDLLDWLQAFVVNRWFAIAGLYWGLFVFFFTTMFTNGAGLGTGVIGSLAYWLVQQGVKRGNQPEYYYLYPMLPLYEFLPVILTLVAAGIGIATLVRRVLKEYGWPYLPFAFPGTRIRETFIDAFVRRLRNEPVEQDDSAVDDLNSVETPRPERQWLDLSAPIAFPWQAFTGFWIVANLVAYSIAGEKMPWLTTHLTTPMILLGGWVLGKALEQIQWRKLIETNTWILFVLIPMMTVALLRVFGPACEFTPANLLCNTIIPVNYQAGFGGLQTTELYPTYAWVAALAALVGLGILAARFVVRIHFGQFWRMIMLCLVGWLVFLTMRASWRAAYIDYDQATEFLVYAHSSGSVKEVMSKVEELSLRTTDGYGIRVAYDDKVSWPMSWYFRDYTNAVFYGDQPTRGALGDAPMIIAGPTHWSQVESLLGDRYYRFEYIRMWWPMQDYFDLEENGAKDIGDFFSNPQLQRGVWEIFYNRDYAAYGSAVGKNFDLNQWPLADRMRLYVRKDTFAQVWSYGVAASEAAQAVDPYAKGVKPLVPDLTFGLGMLGHPHGMAIGPDNLLYVADSANHRITVFDQNGQFIRSIGKYGLAPETDVLNEPWDVGVAPDGRVVIADTWNHRIVEFSPDGKYLATRGYQGPNILTDPLAFWGPRGIDVDSAGLVYLADTGNKRIQVFDAQGKFIRQLGSGGSADGQLDEPAGVVVSKNTGNVYVADTWNQRVSVYSATGDFVKQWPVDAWFAQSNERPYIALDNQDNVYVTDPEAFRVIVFDKDGKFLYTFGDFETIKLAGGLAINDQGQLFLSDTGAGTIQRYDININSIAP